MTQEKHEDDSKREGLSTLQVTQSVLAAAIGVQSRKNKERDFTRGKPLQFIVGGLIFTALFILAIVLFVQFLLKTA